ncbi:MAG: hypothetical protein HZA35_04325, partial [Parcubacteria group bacterium]|nr:hypothetical protein [Parcubacteria group bacterium]
MANQYLFFLLDKKWRSVVFLSAFIVISTLFVLKPEMVWADGCGTSNSAVASETVSCGWMQYVGNAAVGPLGIDMALYLPSNTTGVTAIYAEYDDMGFSAMNGTQGILSTYSGDHTCYGRTNGSVSGNIPVQFFPGRNNNVNIYAYDTCGGYRGGKIIFQITHNLTPPVPTLSSFTITPNPVSYNSPTYLSWNTSGNVDYCEASDGWSGQKATS